VVRGARATASPQVRTCGDLADFSMSALAQALQLGGRTARLRVQHGAVTTTLDFQLGAIKHAMLEAPGVEATGDDAAVEALGMERGMFQILPIPESVPHTVFLDTASLMLRAATRTDEIVGRLKDSETQTIEASASGKHAGDSATGAAATRLPVAPPAETEAPTTPIAVAPAESVSSTATGSDARDADEPAASAAARG
jgi:hypothetical protein